MEILKILLKKIEEAKASAHSIKVTLEEARQLYDHLNEYHRVKLPSFEVWQNTMFFYGYRLTIAESE